jgi:stearoyl-CoA desaturase (delta-9 desaturase)
MNAAAERFRHGYQWPVIAYMALMHIGAAVLCLLFPSWAAVKAAILCYVVTGFGITIGYHRLLTHGSFSCVRWVERLLAVTGLLAGEGPPLYWVMNHRKHHKYSDRTGDPHCPANSFGWSHWLWLFPKHQRAVLGREYARWIPKLARQGFYRRLESSYLWIQAASGALIFAAGYAAGSWYMAFSFLGYAYFLRTILVLHATWSVNSLGHTSGTRRYDSRDESRNNVFVAVVALGEGWHNNHHHVQTSANHGHAWWEFDLSFVAILMFAVLSRLVSWTGSRLVWGVKVFRPGGQHLETWFS